MSEVLLLSYSECGKYGVVGNPIGFGGPQRGLARNVPLFFDLILNYWLALSSIFSMHNS